MVQLPAVSRDFSLLSGVQNGSGVLAVSNSMGSGALSLWA